MSASDTMNSAIQQAVTNTSSSVVSEAQPPLPPAAATLRWLAEREGVPGGATPPPNEARVPGAAPYAP